MRQSHILETYTLRAYWPIFGEWLTNVEYSFTPPFFSDEDCIHHILTGIEAIECDSQSGSLLIPDV